MEQSFIFCSYSLGRSSEATRISFLRAHRRVRVGASVTLIRQVARYIIVQHTTGPPAERAHWNEVTRRDSTLEQYVQWFETHEQPPGY